VGAGSKLILRLHPEDNVVVALEPLPSGTSVPEEALVCRDAIAAGHKVATTKIEPYASVRKYGQIIGFASRCIDAGELVHVHNVELKDFSRDYAIGADARRTVYAAEGDRHFFQGIIRADGRTATRNYLGILATASCALDTARLIAEAFRGEALAEFPNVDGVVALGPSTGCCMVPGGEGFLYLQRSLAGFARHPNFAGILLVGLGCEQNQVHALLTSMGLNEGALLHTMDIQEAGGVRETVRRGVAVLRDMLPEANRVERSPVPASRLVLGLECGGSDGYSGISANPALGAAADLLVRQGGTAVLSETTEIYGAEHLLTRRAVSREVGEKLIERIRWWEDYTARLGGSLNNNPTPGNKAGGLTTILEKSLGAAAKGGTTNLMEVYGYAEAVTAKGLVFMDTPGHDPVSVTGLIAGGVHLICFTTGRGSVLGSKPAPTIKLASNTPLYQRMAGDMDLNCGAVLEGQVSIEEMGRLIFDLVLETASGQRTKSERLGFGDFEFNPWHLGVVL
jgi:arabinonate dehydratase